jgi:hypothetical protein
MVKKIAIWVLIILAIIALSLVIIYFISFNQLITGNLNIGQPIYITILAVAFVILSVLALLLVLILSAIKFIDRKVFDKNQAFGLPDGSIRAVIALSLIVIFAEASLFLYTDLSKVSTSDRLNGLTKEIMAGIPANELLKVDYNETNQTYSVIRRISNSTDSSDFAKQLLTTLSTLVVSLTSFYFGSRFSESKSSDISKTKPTITSTDPTNAKKGQDLTLLITGKDLLLINDVSLVHKTNINLSLHGSVESSESTITAKYHIPDEVSYIGVWDIIAKTNDDKVALPIPQIIIK